MCYSKRFVFIFELNSFISSWFYDRFLVTSIRVHGGPEVRTPMLFFSPLPNYEVIGVDNGSDPPFDLGVIECRSRNVHLICKMS